jgi:hypothetical protein
VRTALVIAVPLGAIFTLFAWRISELLSPDAIGMALGMLLGVLSGVPTAALVIVASRRHREGDDWQPPVIINVPPSAASTMPMAPPSTGNSFRMIESTSRQTPLARSGPVYDYSGDTTTIRWPEPVPCVLLWPGRPVERQWSQFTTPLDEALSSGGICYVLESEWSQYVAAQRGSRDLLPL